MEIWKDIEGWNNIYQISNLGRVKSLKRKGCLNDRIINPEIDWRGYLSMRFKRGNIKKNYKVHRLVAIAFIPNPKNKPQVNHIDGSKVNNKLSNLEWVTPQENIQHAFDSGLIVKRKGRHKIRKRLSDNEIISVIKLLNKGASSIEISKRYPINRESIRKLKVAYDFGYLLGMQQKTSLVKK